MSSEIAFTLDGVPMTAAEGQSIAGALIGSGIMSWRHTRFDDQPRGVFCGIGACFDCLITVNDEPNVRACLAPVRAGDRVMRQEGTGYDGRELWVESAPGGPIPPKVPTDGVGS